MSSRNPTISLKANTSDEQRALSMWQDTFNRLLRSPSARFWWLHHNFIYHHQHIGSTAR